jgi:hypothetical protein
MVKRKRTSTLRHSVSAPRRSVQALAGQFDGAPSFWGGMAHILDLGNTLVPIYQLPVNMDHDRIAFLLDWYALTRDAQIAWSMTVQHYG